MISFTSRLFNISPKEAAIKLADDFGILHDKQEELDLYHYAESQQCNSKPFEIEFIARILATQKNPVGIYFINEDIYTLASYFPNRYARARYSTG